MNRLIAHPRVLSAMLDDYAWAVAAVLIEDSPESWDRFVEGCLTMERLFATRRWRRRDRRHAA